MSETKTLIAELHKGVRKVKKFRKVVVSGLDNTWAIDLMEMPAPALNDDNKYVLVVEDVFSRYIWMVALQNKKKETTWEAMKSVFLLTGIEPKKLWADQGGEFYNDVWEKGLKKKNIILYSTYSDFGVSVVESAIKTLKNWTQPRMEEQGSLRWIEILTKVIAMYNNEKKHSALKMTPAEARKADEMMLYERMYGVPQPMQGKPKYAVGDWVRVSRKKNIFEKGYDARWTYQPFKIREVGIGDPVVYYLEESDGEKIIGAFYEEELQKTEVPYAVLVQDVLKRQKGKAFVSYRGIPKKFNQWLDESAIEDLG